MSELEISVLRVLRVFGPCSNADVARRLGGVTMDQTYPVVRALVNRGLATHWKRQEWDISARGRRFFTTNGINEPRLFKVTT